MMKLQQLLQSKREDILAVALRHGAFNVRVFGSVARGKETETSDIDGFARYSDPKSFVNFLLPPLSKGRAGVG